MRDKYIRESGFIAQEIYYDVPELRHLITVPKDADLSGNPIPTSSDPQIDPDYSNWGSQPASINYSGFIPYLTKGMQEQQEIIKAEKTKIAHLEAKNATLEDEVATLKSKLNKLLNKFNTLETIILNN